MEYKLSRPVAFRGKNYETVILSDYFKTKHKLAMAENSKKTEEEQQLAFLMSFCEDFPKEAFGEIAADDMDFIADHVAQIMLAYARSKGIDTDGKKPRRQQKMIISPVRKVHGF